MMMKPSATIASMMRKPSGGKKPAGKNGRRQ